MCVLKLNDVYQQSTKKVRTNRVKEDEDDSLTRLTDPNRQLIRKERRKKETKKVKTCIYYLCLFYVTKSMTSS